MLTALVGYCAAIRPSPFCKSALAQAQDIHVVSVPLVIGPRFSSTPVLASTPVGGATIVKTTSGFSGSALRWIAAVRRLRFMSVPIARFKEHRVHD